MPGAPDDGVRFSSGIGSSALVAELGIDMDSDYIAVTGGIKDAIDEVPTSLNTVHEGYERDLGITQVVTVLVLHLVPLLDPCTSTIGFLFNQEQVAYWTNDPTVQAIAWGLVLTMTGRDTCDPGGIGCNLIGRATELASVCNRNRAFCYAEYLSSDTNQAILVAYELGPPCAGTHCAAG